MCRLSLCYVDRAIVTGWLVQVPNSAKVWVLFLLQESAASTSSPGGLERLSNSFCKFFNNSSGCVSQIAYFVCNGWLVRSVSSDQRDDGSHLIPKKWSSNCKMPLLSGFWEGLEASYVAEIYTPFVTFQHVGRPVLDSWRHSSCKHRHSGQWLKWPLLIDFTTLFLVYLVCASCALSLMRLLSFL